MLYLVAAGVLLGRQAHRLRGFGMAVAVQGAFLLGFDLFFWWRCSRAVG